MIATIPPPTRPQLTLERIEPGQWRLCDPLRPRDDAKHLVAYLEQDRAGIDVIWLRGQYARARYGSVREVLRDAARR